MRNPRIYTPQPLAVNQVVELTDSAANHVGKVLRMNPEEPLVLFNGEDSSFQGKITEVSKKTVSVVLESEIESATSSPLKIHLGQTLSRGERMDYAIQKATEMGVTEITPLFSERCEVKLKADRLEKRLNHWQQVAISACEQCGLNRVPVIHPPKSVSDWAKEQQSELKFVLHHRTEKKLEGFDQPKSVSLMIGPEGGLTADEIVMAEGQGFNALALGPRVLRTETAPITAVTLMQYLWGDI
ncbi:16S rRNA (uracil(1498)-N(3))-methyltransferase [Endozoicomonas sp. OPT23]|uniref:16S rRNA (uracil(1498)-N(3))-methyltransferase n=1 Tax=Endozoicomonas sp. OPT23 TaxID=2072845 RepID=UPI00129C0E85|nr:16S rRNA (uracil(1498)-N(3))-methyltransferase [Endozoicomonas sp. OPT23]MRI31550.1 16S rRNA (uracil(1498)-N(3))-methyltransferase [Endozoicomonas sp. OPT23]